jgi:hypothetical protein
MPFGALRKAPMSDRRHLLAACAICCSLLLGSCASTTRTSFQEVRDFADQSARLSAYGELSTRFRDTYAREQLYLAPGADRIGREADRKRRAVFDDFLSAQKVVVLYLQTLSLLAGPDRYDLSDQLDQLGKAINANTESGLERRHVLACTGMTRLLTRVIGSAYQGHSVETMVRDGDADLQGLIDAMLTLTHLYAKTYDNEKKTTFAMFDVEIPFAIRSQDRMLVTLAKVHAQSKSAEYKILDRRYALALQGLSKVSLGHQQLREHLAELHGVEMRIILASYVRDLQLIHAALASN